MTVTAAQTDEDYRLKYAREGRALYVPGKTQEEIMAEAAEIEVFNMSIATHDADRYDKALNNAVYLYENAGNVFECLQQMIIDGHLERHICAVAYLSSVAMQAKANTEGAALEELATLFVRSRGTGDAK